MESHWRQIQLVDESEVEGARPLCGWAGLRYRNEATEMKHCVEWIVEQRVPPDRTSRLPLRPVDVFRDLGMTEEAIASYLWRWHCAGSSIVPLCGVGRDNACA